jgi:hypothetical protein
MEQEKWNCYCVLKAVDEVLLNKQKQLRTKNLMQAPQEVASKIWAVIRL